MGDYFSIPIIVVALVPLLFLMIFGWLYEKKIWRWVQEVFAALTLLSMAFSCWFIIYSWMIIHENHKIAEKEKQARIIAELEAIREAECGFFTKCYKRKITEQQGIAQATTAQIGRKFIEPVINETLKKPNLFKRAWKKTKNGYRKVADSGWELLYALITAYDNPEYNAIHGEPGSEKRQLSDIQQKLDNLEMRQNLEYVNRVNRN